VAQVEVGERGDVARWICSMRTLLIELLKREAQAELGIYMMLAHSARLGGGSS
jgi:hypothetical protein